MMRRFWLSLAGCAAAFVAMPAQAASYDCAKASTPDERAVCRNPQLSMLDTEMGALWFSYSRIPMGMGSNGGRQDDARQFLSQRAACGANAACLSRLYTRRNAALRQDVTRALGNLSG